MATHYRVVSRTNNRWSRAIAANSEKEAIEVVAAATVRSAEAYYAYPIRVYEHPDNLKDEG